jgi:hypothetical protein
MKYSFQDDVKWALVQRGQFYCSFSDTTSRLLAPYLAKREESNSQIASQGHVRCCLIQKQWNHIKLKQAAG